MNPMTISKKRIEALVEKLEAMNPLGNANFSFELVRGGGCAINLLSTEGEPFQGRIVKNAETNKWTLFLESHIQQQAQFKEFIEIIIDDICDL